MRPADLIPDENTSLFKIAGGITIVLLLTLGISFVTGIISSTTNVVTKEFGAEAALKKYEWFKEASAELDRKVIDVEIYQQRVDTCYKRNERNCGIVEEQFFGLKSSYNGLVAEYNAASNKFNWSMFDATDGDRTIKQLYEPK